MDEIIGDAIESLWIKKLSLEAEVGKWVSDMEWGIDDFDEVIVLGGSWPLVWSVTGLFVLFSC